MIWVSPDGVASALEAIIHTTRWLLGEREWAPISRELYWYPDLPVPLIRTHAEDAIFGYKWTDASEWLRRRREAHRAVGDVDRRGAPHLRVSASALTARSIEPAPAGAGFSASSGRSWGGRRRP